MRETYWLGAQELVVVYKNGTHIVLDSWEDDPVFQGSYAACHDFCKAEETAYLESLI